MTTNTVKHTPTDTREWQEWNGGECPVDGEHVDVRLRNGDEMHDWYPGHINWGRDLPMSDHVVAYRLVRAPQEKGRAE